MKYIPDAFNFEKIGSVAASIIAERTKADGSHGKALVSFTIVEPRFNEPLYNEVLGITVNDILQPGQSYSKMYGREPRYNELRYHKILVLTKTIEKPKRKIYPHITNKMPSGDRR